MNLFQLAQLNVARLRAPIDDPLIADFVARLPEVNALAERSPGFVWRLQDVAGDATHIRAYDDPLIIVNLTVWASIEALYDFAFRSDHRDVMRRRREWFDKLADAYVVLWWIPAGSRPTVTEARERLDRLRRDGPTPDAFTFRARFPPP
jgi:hypothetical protein